MLSARCADPAPSSQWPAAGADLSGLQMETVSNFLAATLSGAGAEGRAAIGERSLGAHLAEDLLMAEEEIERLGSTITQQVALKHLDSLCELLRSMAGVDPMEAVSALYRCAPACSVSTKTATSNPHTASLCSGRSWRRRRRRRCVRRAASSTSLCYCPCCAALSCVSHSFFSCQGHG